MDHMIRVLTCPNLGIPYNILNMLSRFFEVRERTNVKSLTSWGSQYGMSLILFQYYSCIHSNDTSLR